MIIARIVILVTRMDMIVIRKVRRVTKMVRKNARMGIIVTSSDRQIMEVNEVDHIEETNSGGF